MGQSGSEVHARWSCNGPDTTARGGGGCPVAPECTPVRLCKPRRLYACRRLQTRCLGLSWTRAWRPLGVSPQINRGVSVPSISQEK